MSLLVGVIGSGAVGGPLIDALRGGDIAGARLGGVLTRHAAAGSCRDIGDLIERSELVVEAAGQDAVREHGPAVLTGGRDLLVVSVGALADGELLELLGRGPGRLHLCAGAVGGLDLLQAVGGTLTAVRLTTYKHPRSLPATALAAAVSQPTIVFDGSAREAAARFPENLNVAAAVALPTLGLDDTRVRLVADPGARRTTHVIEASGEIGHYRFEIGSNPSAEHPATSAIVPHAVIRAVRSLTGHPRWSFR